tara:strand:+ start:5039 stop:5551 length:513 start_codon:yes stop_codon:yes gene_type:complete
LLRVLIPLITIIFILGIIWLIRSSNKRINEALIKASEKLNFLYSPSKSIFKKKITSGIIDGYKCEIIVYTQSHGQSSTTYVSFFTYFPDSLNMGIKINWRGQFEGDDDHVANLFIERNIDLVESQKKKLRRLKITDTYVNSRKILFKKYYNPEEIIKTMQDVVDLTKKIK